MAKKKAETKPIPAPVQPGRVTVIGTGKHPNHQVAGRIRKINAKRAERLVKLGWFEYA